jgi:hypothetical protein
MSKSKQLQIRNSTAEFLIFTSQAGEDSIEVRVADEMIWLSQKLMAALFEVTVSHVNQHLTAIYAQGELAREATIKKFLIVQQEGQREVSHTFLAKVQNKLHYAIHGHTAPELIMDRADLY